MTAEQYEVSEITRIVCQKRPRVCQKRPRVCQKRSMYIHRAGVCHKRPVCSSNRSLTLYVECAKRDLECVKKRH